MPSISIIHEHIPLALRGPTLVSPETRLPRYWATVWSSMEGAGLAHNTLRQKLTAIDSLYLCAQRQFGEDVLDTLLAKMDFTRIESLMTGRFVELQNEALQKSVDNRKTWASCYAFVSSILERLSTVEGDISELNRLRTSLLRLDRQFKSLHPGPRRTRPMALRSLPSTVIEDIYEIIQPSSPRNPFRTEELQWRNFCLILLLLHQGLRRGEALLLLVDSLKSGTHPTTGKRVNWLNVTQSEAQDTRNANRPSIKTRYAHRQIPVSEEIAQVWHHFVDNFRTRKRHPYLFSNTRGEPLSGVAPGRILKSVSDRLVPKALEALKDGLQAKTIRTHDLRHTCAVIRLSQFKETCISDDEVYEKLRAFFGWSYSSEMPRHYARAYFESRLAAVWHDDFDANVELLRNIAPPLRMDIA